MNHRPRIAVLGSINMDLVLRCRTLPKPGETILADDVQEIPGGKGANQAVGAARLGAEVHMIGRVGSDAYAERLFHNLKAEGIDTRWVQRTESCGSGLAIVCVDHQGENAILVAPGANAKVCQADVEHAKEVIRNGDVLMLQLEIPLDTVQFAVQLARSFGTRVVLDPAPAPHTFQDELLDVDVICPNESEAATILGQEIHSDEDALGAVKVLANRGPKWAIITRGAKGIASCWQNEASQLLPAFPVQAVDGTAAGDAFAAAIAVALARGFPPEAALRAACAAGAISASRFGAQPSLPTWPEIEERINRA